MVIDPSIPSFPYVEGFFFQGDLPLSRLFSPSGLLFWMDPVGLGASTPFPFLVLGF